MSSSKSSHRRGRSRGWGDWAGAEFGDRRSGGGSGRRRMRRGDVRGEVLTALLDGPAHGYEVMRRLEERSGGFWRPSPGSVYPTLQLLEDSGMVKASETDGRRTYELTDEGRAEAEQYKARGDSWSDDDPKLRGQRGVREAAVSTVQAAAQVAGVGRPDQVERAVAVLSQAGQALYRILSEDDVV